MPASLARRRAIIVGAGQSGLAVAAALSAEGLQPQQDFVVIDAAAPGQRSWSSRWHSMVLLSDARHSALPARRHPGDQRLHPRVDEMVGYLKVVEAAIGVDQLALCAEVAGEAFAAAIGDLQLQRFDHGRGDSDAVAVQGR